MLVIYHLTLFLLHEKTYKQISGEVRDSKLNRGCGYDLEIPCEYNILGLKVYIDKLEIFVRIYKVKTCSDKHETSKQDRHEIKIATQL